MAKAGKRYNFTPARAAALAAARERAQAKMRTEGTDAQREGAKKRHAVRQAAAAAAADNGPATATITSSKPAPKPDPKSAAPSDRVPPVTSDPPAAHPEPVEGRAASRPTPAADVRRALGAVRGLIRPRRQE